MAEALEKAGKAGDFAFITAHNPALIETVSKLVSDIEEAIALSGGDFVAWLRENVDQMNYAEIAERVGGIILESDWYYCQYKS